MTAIGQYCDHQSYRKQAEKWLHTTIAYDAMSIANENIISFIQRYFFHASSIVLVLSF